MKGPGTEMRKILESIGIYPRMGCRCKQLMIDMDEWGVVGCRLERTYIINVMEESAEQYNWKDFVIAAALSALFLNVRIIGFKIDALNPFPGLLDLAIHRADGLPAGPMKGTCVSYASVPAG